MYALSYSGVVGEDGGVPKARGGESDGGVEERPAVGRASVVRVVEAGRVAEKDDSLGCGEDDDGFLENF